MFVVVIFFAQLIGLRQLAQAAGSPCNSPNGSLFNLEPRPNAVVQVARSLAVLPNPAGNNNLVVAVGADARGLEGENSPIISEDAFYVERSGSDCTPDFEGGLPSILTPENHLFVPAIGTPSVSALACDSWLDLALLVLGITVARRTPHGLSHAPSRQLIRSEGE